MLIEPKIRGFICTTAHPQGCAANVAEQIAYVQQQPHIQGPKRVLVIGASTGYGLASRIVSAFGAGAATIGVFFERPAVGSRTASAGWYNSAAFEEAAKKQGLYAKSINGDAFSDDIKQATIDLIQQDWGGEVDLVIYSLASPKRQHPETGEVFNSCLKPIGQVYTNKTIDVMTGAISEVSLEPATEAEIEQTVAVMGGDDWQRWMQQLSAAGVLAKGVMTVAYTYIGPELTFPLYHRGTIGRAKADLERHAIAINQLLSPYQGKAFISVNKALVTQASAAIPVVPLYISILYKIMKAQGLHEGCIEQIERLFQTQLYPTDEHSPSFDAHGRIRIDDWEMRPEIQAEVSACWEQVHSGNSQQITDVQGYRAEFERLFGFGIAGINYQADVDPDVTIPSIPK